MTRAQHFSAPRMLAHFQILGLVTAGRDTGNRSFERQQSAEHLRFAVAALAAVGVQHTQVRLTCLEDASRPVVEGVRDEFAGLPGLTVIEDNDRTTGRSYCTRSTPVLKTTTWKSPTADSSTGVNSSPTTARNAS
ncbi:hypothetical protein [Streptomyces sp. NPDC001876]|uniref:hypothetical protein n=1 Tax=Streptomyces sp. NPDC001876 TaxID=3154402 RepID=UPI00332393CA